MTKLTTLPASSHPQDTPIDSIALGEILSHKSARVLQANIAASIPPAPAKSISDLYNYLILSNPTPKYDSICFRTGGADGKVPHLDEAGLESKSTYFTRSIIHTAIFTYIFKRISCLALIEAEGYRINNYTKDDQRSATDAAFVYFLETLLQQAGLPDRAENTETPATAGIKTTEATEAASTEATATEKFEKSAGHGTSLLIDDPRALRAYGIFTQHPMKFKVQIKIGQNLQTEERAVVWCIDSGEEGTHGWDVQWEYMSKSLTDVECPDRNYQF